MKLSLMLNLDLSADGLRQAVRDAETLAAQLRALLSAAEDADEHEPESEAMRAARSLLDHLGEGADKVFRAWAVHFEAGTEHKLDEVAELLDDDRETVKSYHRNSGRTLKKLGLTHVWRSRWDGSRSMITMDEEIHRALAALVR